MEKKRLKPGLYRAIDRVLVAQLETVGDGEPNRIWSGHYDAGTTFLIPATTGRQWFAKMWVAVNLSGWTPVEPEPRVVQVDPNTLTPLD